MFVAVVVQDGGFVVDHGFQVDGAAPEGMDVLEGFAGVTQVEFGAFVAVLHVELAIAVVVAILNLQIRETEVGHV